MTYLFYCFYEYRSYIYINLGPPLFSSLICDSPN